MVSHLFDCDIMRQVTAIAGLSNDFIFEVYPPRLLLASAVR